MSIIEQLIAEPGKFSIDQLKQGVQHGVIPAYIGIPLIQDKLKQQQTQVQVMCYLDWPQQVQQQHMVVLRQFQYL